jgi:hypothetical protein
MQLPRAVFVALLPQDLTRDDLRLPADAPPEIYWVTLGDATYPLVPNPGERSWRVVTPIDRPESRTDFGWGHFECHPHDSLDECSGRIWVILRNAAGKGAELLGRPRPQSPDEERRPATEIEVTISPKYKCPPALPRLAVRQEGCWAWSLAPVLEKSGDCREEIHPQLTGEYLIGPFRVAVEPDTGCFMDIPVSAR